MAQYDLNLRDYWRVLRRRKGVVLFVTLAFGALAYLFAQIQKPEPIYQATAVVKFERSTTLVGLLVETISLSSGDNLATQAALVRSFPVLERAAKAVRMIPPETSDEAIKRNPNYLKLLGDLRDQVKAAPEENTTLIDIAVTSPDPGQAARIANAVAQAYQEENRLARNRQVREARRFIEEQLAEVGGRLRASEESITALREQRGIVSPPEETNATLGRLTALETESERIRLAQQETASQIQALQEPRATSGEGPPRIFTDAGDPSIAKLNSALLDLIIERDNLLLTLTPEHPQVRDLTARIANVRANLLRELRLKEQALRVRAEQLQRQIAQVRQGQRTMPELAQQYTQLRREITISENLLTTLRTKLQEVQIKEKEQVEEVSLVRPATEPAEPINRQQTSGKAVVVLLIGLTIGLVLAFVLESLDTSIGTIQDVETYLGSSVMGLIPNIDLSRDTSLAPAHEDRDSPLRRMRPFLLSLLSPKSTITKTYRSLRTNMDFLATKQSLKTLVTTSASIMEGKTTTAINLAITMAQIGKRVLLVEADLRRPFVHHAFGIPRDPGLAEVIVGNRDWRECIRTMKDLMQGPLGSDPLSAVPNIDKLFIMTSGTPPAHPAEFLNSARMTSLIATLRQEFDLVLFDCSPVLPVTDAAILAPKTDGVIIVYRAGRTPRSALRRAKSVLEHVRGKVLGVVLTGVRAEFSPDYEELEYYRYAYVSESGERSGGRRQSRRASLFGGRRHGVSLARALLLLLLLGGVVAGGWAWYTEWPLETARQFALDVLPEPVHSWVAPWIETPPPQSPQPPRPPAQPATPSQQAAPPAPVALPAPTPAAPGQQAALQPTGEAEPQLAAAVPVPHAAAPTPQPVAQLPTTPSDPAAQPPATAKEVATAPGPTTPPLAPTAPQPAPATPPVASPPAAPAAPPAERQPFSLQVAATPRMERGFALAERLRAGGWETFTVPTELPGKGVTYRIFLGSFASEAAAAAARKALHAKGIKEQPVVKSLPLAVEVPDLASADQAAGVLRGLRDGGYMPILRREGPAGNAEGKLTLVLEAFANQAETEPLTAFLRAYGLTPQLVER